MPVLMKAFAQSFGVDLLVMDSGKAVEQAYRD
jgi:hypothetical protein